MMSQTPKKKGFFAKYWGLLLGGGLLLGLLVIAGLGAGAYFLFLKGDPSVTSISVLSSQPIYGETLTVKALVENKGVLDADYHAVLLVDGKEAASQDITLKSKDPQSITFNVEGLAAGKHKAALDDSALEFTIYRPANLSVTDFTVEPAEIMVGETIKVKAKVKNSGDLNGQYGGPVLFDGLELQSFTGDVGPGEEKDFEAEFTITSRGAHTVSLEDKSLPVSVTAPANIEVTGLTLSKTYPKPKEAVTATVTVQNTGDLPGQYTVDLLINGKSAQKKEVTVEANSSLDVAFKVAQSKAGRYSVKAGGFTQSLRVVILTRPANGAFLVRKASRGANLMEITNHYSKDVIVTLTRSSSPKSALITIYIRAKSKVTIKKIPNGDYLFYYSIGSSYDSASKRFITDPVYLKSDAIYRFNPPRGYYSRWTIDLNTSSGNTGASDVDESGFPQ